VAVEAESGEKLVLRRIPAQEMDWERLARVASRVPLRAYLKPEEKKCPCCGLDAARIGTEVSEQLEYIPSSFKVYQHYPLQVRLQACNHGLHHVRTAGPDIDIALREADKNGCTDTPEALRVAPDCQGTRRAGAAGVWVYERKLGTHLRCTCLDASFARQVVHIARSTMCAWLLGGRRTGGSRW